MYNIYINMYAQSRTLYIYIYIYMVHSYIFMNEPYIYI